MKKDVKEFVKQWQFYQDNKQPTEITSTSTEAFEKVALDIVGPLPITENGNKYILTLQDDLTKYSQAYALPQHDADTIANFIVLFVISFVNLAVLKLFLQIKVQTSCLIKRFVRSFF